MNTNATTPTEGFEKCVAEWKKKHAECMVTGPLPRERFMMRFAYEEGRKDGRQHK